jgi:octaprenyl-diphosphate synthase
VSTGRTIGAVAAPPAAAPSLVGDELQLVEHRLAELLRSREARLTDIANYLIGAGGKRVRPAVTLLVFRACGGSQLADIVDVAVALELIHSASLLHDDIIDGNEVRRGRDSARRKYGVAETLVTGDFLFSRAFQICGRFDERLIDWAAEACIALTEGEIMQGRFRRNPAVTYADYLEIIARKTASLFEVGARTAAYLAGAEAAAVDAMARCGRHVGMTFQMIDDLLDVTAAEATLGKPVGLDVRDGNPSLPIVLALADDAELRRLFAEPALSDGDVALALSRLRTGDILERGHQLALEHAGHARNALRSLPESPFREYLLSLVDQLVERIS